ncbi:hypothetical protein [Shewanella sp. MBTL60-112-B1]|uniref:hypothetical protein n=2 Tax=unclassified Shewanella TaxID=196818 RepID=UPI001BC2F1CA|nr:hypothetical protein [Shewanella sp. MBTL60-112-B1]GIU17238.1 hypothetical protein TUM4444_30870 [Shewanella sp. MBTL60-112-B1]
MRFTFFAIFLLLVGSNNANANSYQCAKLENGSSIAFELRKDSNFENCLSIGTDNLDGLSVIYESVGAEQSDLELFAITSASNYQLLNIFSSNNDNRISFVSQATTAYSQLGLRILPTNFELRDKIVRVSFFIEEKEAVVLIKMQNVPGTSSGETTPPPNPDEDLCRKNCGTAPLSLMQSCEYTDQGTVDSSFDTVAHAQYFSDMKTLIESTYGEGSLRASLTTGAMMAMNFYTNMPYDLKNSSVYTADATFGNYFYGIAAQRMGYSKEEAVKAGAAVQTAQISII